MHFTQNHDLTKHKRRYQREIRNHNAERADGASRVVITFFNINTPVHAVGSQDGQFKLYQAFSRTTSIQFIFHNSSYRIAHNATKQDTQCKHQSLKDEHCQTIEFCIVRHYFPCLNLVFVCACECVSDECCRYISVASKQEQTCHPKELNRRWQTSSNPYAIDSQ